jgi:hypothetical protein
MAVFLSPVGGVAAQFFDNNGNVLSGGKLFTYAAGSTTPAATFTSSLGITAHTNPIVLDAAGRVPGGEIWLTDGIIYKFVLQTSTNVLIATYDNIVGINSNFVNFTLSQEIQTATAGQTVFTLNTMQYQPGTNSLSVFVDGVNQYGPGAQFAYVETDATTVTFVSGLHVGASVKFTSSTQTTGNATDASVVSYTPPFVNSVTTNVEAKLAQIVSVKDFGAVGDGVADDTAAINAALQTPNTVLLPQGTYRVTAQLVFGASCSGLIGEGMYLSVISKEFNGNAILCDTNGAVIQHIGIDGNGATYTDSGIVPRGYNILIQHCRINDTADSPIKVAGAVGSNDLAATYLRVDSCFLNPTNAATTYAIRSISADDSNRPTARVFSNLSGGSSLVDFSGMNYAVLENSLGTIIKFDNNCSKIRITGNRFTNAAANITIFGQDHVIDGNLWNFGSGFGLTIDASAAAVYFGPNNNINIGGSSFASIVDGTPLNGGNFNNLTNQLVPFPLGWYGSVTNPTLGNSLNDAWYKQEGRTCWATFSFIRGTTATIGSGTYSFQLPFKAFVDARGTILVKSSSGTFYVGVLVVNGGSSVAFVYFHGATGPWNAADFAFSNNAVVEATITYLIAPT